MTKFESALIDALKVTVVAGETIGPVAIKTTSGLAILNASEEFAINVAQLFSGPSNTTPSNIAAVATTSSNPTN